MHINHRKQHLHATRSFRAQHVSLVLDHTVLATHRGGRLCFVRVLTIVVDAELSTQEVGPHFAQEA